MHVLDADPPASVSAELRRDPDAQADAEPVADAEPDGGADRCTHRRSDAGTDARPDESPDTETHRCTDGRADAPTGVCHAVGFGAIRRAASDPSRTRP